MERWLRNNSFSLFFVVLFIFTWLGQAITGEKVYNDEMSENGGTQVTFFKYLATGHFVESTFENWESEFLQMALFVIVSAYLYQKGSSESKNPDQKEKKRKSSGQKNKSRAEPKRGWLLRIYEHSLSLVLTLLFLVSFLLHLAGSYKDYNQEQQLKNLPTQTLYHYFFSSRFWFESFQNWQSEFLSVFAIIVLSIFLREKNSPQSKPMDAPDSQTGD